MTQPTVGPLLSQEGPVANSPAATAPNAAIATILPMSCEGAVSLPDVCPSARVRRA
jgi:hypothetical protein